MHVIFEWAIWQKCTKVSYQSLYAWQSSSPQYQRKLCKNNRNCGTKRKEYSETIKQMDTKYMYIDATQNKMLYNEEYHLVVSR